MIGQPTMMASPLEDRRRALEEAFFSKKNKQLLDALREEISQADRKQALSAAVQIYDEGTLDLLIQADITVESLLAFKLLPLVEVAWADHQPRNLAGVPGMDRFRRGHDPSRLAEYGVRTPPGLAGKYVYVGRRPIFYLFKKYK